MECARLLATAGCHVKARKRLLAQTFDVSSKAGAPRSASSVSSRLNTRPLRDPDITGGGDAAPANSLPSAMKY